MVKLSKWLALMAVAVLPTMASAQQIDIQTVTLAPKAEAWLVESHDVPVINVKLAFTGVGTVSDPAGQEGRARMAAALLTEGAGELTSLAFQRVLEDHAIKLAFSIDKDRLTVDLQTLSENRDKAFELLGLALTKPRLDKDAIERVRAQMHASLRQMEEQPGYIANQVLEHELLGTHPYVKPEAGTHEGIDGITEASLRHYVKDAVTFSNVQMAVVGDVDAAQLKALTDKYFVGMNAEFAPLVEVPDLEVKTAGQTVTERRSIPQTVVMFAGPGIARNDPDFYAAYVMNHLLGGSTLTSKVGDEIREKRGLAYYAYTSLELLDHGAWFGGSFGTRNDQAPDALRVLTDTLAKAAAGEISDQEVADAKGYIIGAYPLSLADNDGIASILMMMQRFNLGKNYIAERNKLIGAVTVDDVRRVAKRLLEGNRLVVVGVGDPSKNLADYR